MDVYVAQCEWRGEVAGNVFLFFVFGERYVCKGTTLPSALMRQGHVYRQQTKNGIACQSIPYAFLPQACVGNKKEHPSIYAARASEKRSTLLLNTLLRGAVSIACLQRKSRTAHGRKTFVFLVYIYVWFTL